MANSQRVRRVADQIQRELSDIIRNELKDPRVGMITLTGVEMSPDLTHAKVFFTSLVDGSQDEVLVGLRRAAGFLRSQLGQRIKIHNTPELHFEYDASIAEGVRLSKLIDAAVQSAPADREE
ncbi:MAG TPA: 30S ribosome-binding factor RbfA [Burkholderiales bacterium]|nr:30S ribosome-binding factor RbfA [Burkholderiales bacterium]